VVKVHSADGTKATIRLRIDGRLGQEQLPYLDELIQIAETSGLRILLDLHNVVTLDSAAIRYLLGGRARSSNSPVPGSSVSGFNRRLQPWPQVLPDSP
jgi:anti-anti-sigma regulatory factor